MKNKYKVVALVPLEFSVEGSSDSKEAIEWCHFTYAPHVLLERKTRLPA